MNFACQRVFHTCRLSSASAAHRELVYPLCLLQSVHFVHFCLHFTQTVFTCLYSPCPLYLSQLIPSPSFSHHTQCSCSPQLNLPAAKSSYGRRAFSFVGASDNYLTNKGLLGLLNQVQGPSYIGTIKCLTSACSFVWFTSIAC